MRRRREDIHPGGLSNTDATNDTCILQCVYRSKYQYTTPHIINITYHTHSHIYTIQHTYVHRQLSKCLLVVKYIQKKIFAIILLQFTLLTIRNYSNIKMGQQSALVFFHSLPLVDLFLALGITQFTCTMHIYQVV